MTHPKSKRDLCQTQAHTEEEPFLALHMAELPNGELGTPFESCRSKLTVNNRFWSDSTTATEYTQGVLNSILAKQLYGAPSEVLIDWAAKSLVWRGEFQQEVGDLHRHLGDSQRQLKESRGRLDQWRMSCWRYCRTWRALEKAQEVIAEYKESSEFKLGLQRSRQVSYEYGYLVTLAQFRAKYPNLEVEENPVTSLPKDD
ncbi:hypothetical protein B296_00006249, partial [Ensete ventricosum]